ncbi:MAG: hypothetical protein HGA22_02920, partial [Clostridiales bacterium]|nr:hypothetical protein [Clostridiales bacterium]
MKFKFRIFSAVLVLLLSASVIINIKMVASAGTSEPGSAEDPIISKSYVDAKMVQLQTQLTQLQTKYDATLNELKNKESTQQGFVVVELKKGCSLLTGDGTEVILRKGTAAAIKGTLGFLADTTSAKDISGGAALTVNHLLISSRNDGRGLKASALCYLLVRGAYTITDSTGAPASTAAPTATKAPVPAATASPVTTAAPTAAPTPAATAAPTPSPAGTATGTGSGDATGSTDQGEGDIPSTAVTG